MMKTISRLAVQARTIVKSHTPTATQVAGLGVFAAGAFVLAPWLGLMVAGGFLCLVGWEIDR